MRVGDRLPAVGGPSDSGPSRAFYLVRRYLDVTQRPAVSADGAGSGRLTAPLDGSVTQLFVAAGQQVEKGTLVLVLEAINMEHRVASDVDGTVERVCVAVGDQVKTRQQLAEITPAPSSEAAEEEAA